MSLELDPIFHTVTMVRILKEQGNGPTAMELAETILETNPGNEEVRTLLEDMKKETRLAFERFQKSGNPKKSASAGAEDTADPKVSEQASNAMKAKEQRVQRLNNLLKNVQEFRKHDERH